MNCNTASRNTDLSEQLQLTTAASTERSDRVNLDRLMMAEIARSRGPFRGGTDKLVQQTTDESERGN